MTRHKDIAFDFDDTLIFSKEIFRKQMGEVYQVLGQVLVGVAIKEEIEAINNESYKTHFVNPNRWDTVLHQFKERHPEVADSMISDCREVLAKIYKTPPEVKPGAFETLETLIAGNSRLGLVTHAYDEWTRFKLESTGLDKFFPKERVHVCDMDKPKSHTEWQAAINFFGWSVDKVVVVGDSVRSDIIPAHKAGVRELYWIHEPDAWAVQLGETPPGTIEISRITELPDKMHQ